MKNRSPADTVYGSNDGPGDGLKLYGSWPPSKTLETAIALADFKDQVRGSLVFQKGEVISIVKRTQNPNVW